VPGLVSIPGLGRLFGTDHSEKTHGELMIALIPHIVRAPDYSEVNLRGIASGPEQAVKLTYTPRAEAPKAPAPAPVTAPGVPVPNPNATPAAGPGAAAAPAAGAPAPPPNPVRLTFSPPVTQVPLSGAVTVSLQIDNAADLVSSPMHLKFDPKVLRLTSVRQGTLLTGDGQKINFSENTLNDTGEASIVLNRLPGSGGVSGSGALVSLTFQAVAKGTTTVSIPEISLRNSQQQPLNALPPTLTVTVQ